MRRLRFLNWLVCSLMAMAGLVSGAVAQTGSQTAAHVTTQTKAEPLGTNGDVWWKHSVIYELYPRSYQDTNNDGLGDIAGIQKRLPYLKSLGIDAIWITPMYPSPQVDFGYDIADYEKIDPQYGTMADFDNMMKT
ncbi:MAG: alpha amylase catalytic region, partial [Acidobacteriaceae bacterium]|nr:alpha amylase catalytic region [Acidobacteriaceae bacterium]